jgi:hypothetical protein
MYNCYGRLNFEPPYPPCSMREGLKSYQGKCNNINTSINGYVHMSIYIRMYKWIRIYIYIYMIIINIREFRAPLGGFEIILG